MKTKGPGALGVLSVNGEPGKKPCRERKDYLLVAAAELFVFGRPSL